MQVRAVRRGQVLRAPAAPARRRAGPSCAWPLDVVLVGDDRAGRQQDVLRRRRVGVLGAGAVGAGSTGPTLGSASFTVLLVNSFQGWNQYRPKAPPTTTTATADPDHGGQRVDSCICQSWRSVPLGSLRWGLTKSFRRPEEPMPRYEYRCRACGDTFEVSRPMAAAGGRGRLPAGARRHGEAALDGRPDRRGGAAAPAPRAGRRRRRRLLRRRLRLLTGAPRRAPRPRIADHDLEIMSTRFRDGQHRDHRDLGAWGSAGVAEAGGDAVDGDEQGPFELLVGRPGA